MECNASCAGCACPHHYAYVYQEGKLRYVATIEVAGKRKAEDRVLSDMRRKG